MAKVFWNCCVLFVLVWFQSSSGLYNGHYPVILVPGDGGTQIKANINKPSVPHHWCNRVSGDWFDLWLNIELLVPFVVQCTVDNMRLVYDNKTRTTSNAPGVETKVTEFGNTTSVEWLDSSHNRFTSYFSNIVDALVTNNNYTRGVDVRGVPYDFRKSPNELQDLFLDITKLTEDTFTRNNNTPVVIIGHSMGNNILLYWLSTHTKDWRDQYIRSFISIAAPWAGAVKPLRLMAAGDNLGVVVVNPLTARPLQRSMSSTAWLMPNDKIWKSDEILVQGPIRNYTVNDYRQFFTDIDYTTGYDMRVDTFKYNYDLDSPKVELHCLHGDIGNNTPASFVFNITDENWYDWQPKVVWGPGDGTVNMKSLTVCEGWRGDNGGKGVIRKAFDGYDHIGILASKEMISYIQTVVAPGGFQANRTPGNNFRRIGKRR